MNTEARLIAMENELRALKQTAPMAIGMLQYPDTNPTASYSGTVDTTGAGTVLARIEATFTRSDGLQITPMVDFAFDFSVSPTYTENRLTIGLQVTGDDPNCNVEGYIAQYEAKTTQDSVTFNVDVLDVIAPYTSGTATIDLQVQAISPVAGTLTLMRTI